MREARIQPLSTAARAGRFEPYGGRYVPETLMAALEELEAAYESAKQDQEFQSDEWTTVHIAKLTNLRHPWVSGRNIVDVIEWEYKRDPLGGAKE